MVKCGGRCGNPGCTFQGSTPSHVFGHIGAVKSKSKLPGSATAKPMTGPPHPSPAGSEARPFYAPLKDLPAGFVPGAKGEPVPAAKAAAPPPGPLFDSTPWWIALGELIDTTVLKDKSVKIRMTEDRAKRLDAALQAAGWSVTANPNPVSLPFWAPIMITVVGAFVLPILVAYIPDAIRKAREAMKARTEARAATPPIAVVTQQGARIQVTPPPEDADEIRMRAAPPPFSWKAMPWRDPAGGEP